MSSDGELEPEVDEDRIVTDQDREQALEIKAKANKAFQSEYMTLYMSDCLIARSTVVLVETVSTNTPPFLSSSLFEAARSLCRSWSPLQTFSLLAGASLVGSGVPLCKPSARARSATLYPLSLRPDPFSHPSSFSAVVHVLRGTRTQLTIPLDKDFNLSIDLYTDAIALNPKDATFWNNRAMSKSKMEEHGAAIADASESSSSFPPSLPLSSRSEICFSGEPSHFSFWNIDERRATDTPTF